MPTKAREYRVVWEIDIEAHNPTEAAKIAQEIQRDNLSIATLFDVAPVNDRGETFGNWKHLDLGTKDQKKVNRLTRRNRP